MDLNGKIRLTIAFYFSLLVEVTTVAGSTQGFSNGFGKNAHFKHIAGISN